MTEHADLEALSAYVDGEAPEWADHLAACPACRASADRLRAVAAAVAAPVPPPPAAHREAAVTAAMDHVVRSQAAERPRVDHPRWDRRWALPAVAAVIVGVLGFSALVATNTGSSDRNTVAGPALESAPTAGDLSAKADSSASAAPAPAAAFAGDLGDVPDAVTLLARARPALAGTPGRSSAAPGSATVPSTVTSPGLRAPVEVGTRPCEEQVRTREPALREVVYFATARRGPVPAFVLGFAAGTTSGPVTLLLLAQDGCAELLRAAGP